MHWIYVLECENNIIYVGETKKLYSRLYQHMNKRGSKHTSENVPKIVNWFI
jgi:predicted GIY-YIG superfamily endonuclease